MANLKQMGKGLLNAIGGQDMKSLSRIGKKHGTDKYRHGYLPFYEEYFDCHRSEKFRLLEIGIFAGQSLRMWAEYFANSSITGCDILEESFITAERVECCHLDQSSRMALAEFRESHREGFDIIIDDGSHVMKDQQTSLAMLFPLLKRGGWYVIEDIHTSTGESEKCFEIYGLERDLSNSTVGMLKAFIESKKIASSYFDEAEADYLNENILSCELFNPKRWSATSMIRKKIIMFLTLCWFWKPERTNWIPVRPSSFAG